MNEEKTKAETIHTLQLLYPIFKEEVYRRRAAIGQIARLASLLFISLTILTIIFPMKNPIPFYLRLLTAGGIAFAVILSVCHICQEKSRHEKAKLQLITLEKGLGFFEKGSYLPNEQLYPSDWQDRPKIDSGMVVSILSIIGTGIVLISLILSM